MEKCTVLLLTVAPHESKGIQTTGFPWVNNLSANARVKAAKKQGGREGRSSTNASYGCEVYRCGDVGYKND